MSVIAGLYFPIPWPIESGLIEGEQRPMVDFN